MHRATEHDPLNLAFQEVDLSDATAAGAYTTRLVTALLDSCFQKAEDSHASFRQALVDAELVSQSIDLSPNEAVMQDTIRFDWFDWFDRFGRF